MELISYKCPNCGAPMVFSIETQRWDCHFCNSSFSKEELDQLNASLGLEESEEASWAATQFDEAEMVAYTCPDCGGRVIAEKNTLATFCAYCHNPTVIASRLQGEYRPARILPFKITKDHVLESLRKLCRRKPLLPKSFKKAVDLGEVTGLYVPFWLFSADMDSTMQAEGRVITSWSDSNYIYTKTDVYRVDRGAMVPFRMIPVDASQRLSDKMMDSIEPFDYEALTDFSMEYLSGYFAESFDVDAAISQKRFLNRANRAVEQVLRGSIRGYQSVNILNLNSSPRGLDNLYAMLPVWTVAVKHRGKIFAFAMNAQTGKSAGELPVSGGRSAVVLAVCGLVVTAAVFVARLLLGGYV